MKLRTSFFEPTVFRKNLTRFAPVWALYCVYLVLMLLVNMAGSSPLAVQLTYTDQYAPIVNLIYALVCALVLFGDLYNPRMTNALHALPLRREGWFFTNVISGLSFSLVPNLAFSLLTLPLCLTGNVSGGLLSPVCYFLYMELSFLFFFGLAVLCAFLVGNRFALTLVYGIINFLSMLVYWLVYTLYVPLLYGIQASSRGFERFSPAVYATGLDLLNYRVYYPESMTASPRWEVYLSDSWTYLIVCAAIGLGLLALALLLYRRRKLECAGDFLALKVCEPVFLVIYALVVGAVIQLGKQIFIGGQEVDGFLYIGLAVGVFTGLMLLQRTVRVFRVKAFLGCAALIGAVLLSIGITKADPLGISTWIPGQEDVQSVTVYYGHNRYRAPGNAITLDDPADIAAVLEVHGYALQEDVTLNEEKDTLTIRPYGIEMPLGTVNSFSFALEYNLADGTTRSRYYDIYVQGDAGQQIKAFLTRTECVLGIPEEELEALAAEIGFLEFSGYVRLVNDRQEILGLLEAVAADCEAGTMAQPWPFRSRSDTKENRQNINFSITLDSGIEYWHNIQIYDDNANTMAWLIAHDIPLLLGEEYTKTVN